MVPTSESGDSVESGSDFQEWYMGGTPDWDHTLPAKAAAFTVPTTTIGVHTLSADATPYVLNVTSHGDGATSLSSDWVRTSQDAATVTATHSPPAVLTPQSPVTGTAVGATADAAAAAAVDTGVPGAKVAGTLPAESSHPLGPAPATTPLVSYKLVRQPFHSDEALVTNLQAFCAAAHPSAPAPASPASNGRAGCDTTSASAGAAVSGTATHEQAHSSVVVTATTAGERARALAMLTNSTLPPSPGGMIAPTPPRRTRRRTRRRKRRRAERTTSPHSDDDDDGGARSRHPPHRVVVKGLRVADVRAVLRGGAARNKVRAQLR